ncbi:unnamed protein product [Nezara viridula]|uniref:T-cell activation inhibitor, mitochondrial n=1 Tax=Nezara viridula TaxID=85310 RepID=A0A9P0H5I7_NEZVI|nr:unnamed protein product [Nezara viridula]
MATEFLRCQLRRRLFVVNGNKIYFEKKYIRHLSSGEIATALRPFYFSVHPDLFGKYPSERAINESSLQSLSSYIQSLQQNKYPRPTDLTFYLRPHGTAPTNNGTFKSVKISLGQADIKKTVVSILSSCNLPTTYVDNLTPSKKENINFRQEFRTKAYNYEEQGGNGNGPERNIKKVKTESLSDWLSENADLSKDKLLALKPVREEVVRLQKSLCDKLFLKAILWECGWNISHFRGCLLAFQALAQHHVDAMTVLKGRTLVFGNDTGVSFDGQILLNISEVRNNWLDFIKNVVREQDLALKTVPMFEKSLSRVLRDIQVVRRKFQPRTMAKTYEANLIRMTTLLSDYQGRRGYPKSWPDTLAKYELVVEAESGPMMVSPTGQFILPCSCPAFLIVNFISENINIATELLDKYQIMKEVEKTIYEECITKLGLISLKKDDCITPEPMIACCSKLLQNRKELRPLLEGTALTVTNYYSVMSDGQICIPWNWKI